MALSRGQKNEVFNTIEGAGMNPGRHFEWDDYETTGHRVVQGGIERHELIHTPSRRTFTFTSPVEASAAPERTPSQIVATVLLPALRLDSGPAVPFWRPQLRRFSEWLDELKRDLETPDLWASVDTGDDAFRGAVDDKIDNTQFTADERDELARRLDVLADEIKTTHELSGSQIRLLDEKVSQLVDASHRLGRKDWLLLFLGVVLTLVVTAALPPEVVQHFLGSFGKHIRPFLGPGGFRGLLPP